LLAGRNPREKPDGTFVISNIQNKDVTIKTLADVGEEWQFYTDSLGINYKAKVQSIDTMTVLGDIDTIKTILITAYLDTLPNPLDDVDGFSIIISKNHGLVRAFDFYIFPYHLPGTLSTVRHEFDYYLDVITHEIWHLQCGGLYADANRATSSNSIFNLIPFRNVRERELYDFEVGDTLKYYNNYSWDWYNRITSKAIFYTSKVVTPDKYRYTYSYQEKQTVYNYGVYNSSTYGTGTDVSEYDTSLLIRDYRLPEEWGTYSLFEYFPDTSVNGCPIIAYKCTSSGIDFTARIVDLAPNGWGGTMLYQNYTTYAIGYGDIHGYYRGFSEYRQEDYLTFASKSGVRCGVYGSVAVQDLLPAEPLKLEIFPNPAGSTLSISAGIKLTDVTISNMLGSTVFQQSIAGTQATLPIAHLPPGLYLLRINNQFVRKFVKE
jgi:hypothetical protein